MPSSASIRCGLSGWEYSHWDALVYPPETSRRFHRLEFLAERFDTIEVPTTFRQFVRPELAQLWASKVARNPNFRFTARLHRLFSHERNLDPSQIATFSEGLRPLLDQDKLGCVLIQFPSSFRFTRENREFLIRLRRAFHGMRLVAELRHSSWSSQEGLGTLIDYHIGYCNLDQPASAWAAGPSAHLTWKIGYVKLYGSHCGPGFDQFDDSDVRRSGNDHLFTQEEIDQWKARILQVARFAESTYVIFANDDGGKSVVNALQLQAMLGDGEQKLPRVLESTYRSLVAPASQSGLFDAPGPSSGGYRAVA